MTLREFYIADLGQLRDASQRMVLEWPLLAARAAFPALRSALDQHYSDTQLQLVQIESLLADLEERPRPSQTEVLTGLLAAWHLRHAQLDRTESRDLCVVSTALAVNCQSFTVFGEAATLAAAVNHVEGMRVLPAMVEIQHTSLQRLGELKDDIATQLGATSITQWSTVLIPVRSPRTHATAQASAFPSPLT